MSAEKRGSEWETGHVKKDPRFLTLNGNEQDWGRQGVIQGSTVQTDSENGVLRKQGILQRRQLRLSTMFSPTMKRQVVHNCNPGTPEAEVGRSPSSRLAG